jgi:hypothetical protein
MLEQMGIAAKAASYKLAQLSSREKIRCWKRSPIISKRRVKRFCAPTPKT